MPKPKRTFLLTPNERAKAKAWGARAPLRPWATRARLEALRQVFKDVSAGKIDDTEGAKRLMKAGLDVRHYNYYGRTSQLTGWRLWKASPEKLREDLQFTYSTLLCLRARNAIKPVPRFQSEEKRLANTIQVQAKTYQVKTGKPLDLNKEAEKARIDLSREVTNEPRVVLNIPGEEELRTMLGKQPPALVRHKLAQVKASI
ncbi:hypothetical protein HYS54_04580 [Candidatus Micrarchaeota archaeon]|nr:hypothetical protein [Candidatus Micrarchaeota archaeon]